MDDLSLKNFVDIDHAGSEDTYVAALKAFDAISQLRELKALARERASVAAGRSVLDVGCGFGLETLRLAAIVGPDGTTVGVDKSADFVADAAARSKKAGAHAEFRVADAVQLPFADASFDCVRAERLLIYLEDPMAAVREMRRVLRPGGRIALIEPDFSTNTLNLPQRDVVRRAMAHEADAAVVQGWLPGPLLAGLQDLGLRDIELASRVLVYPQELGATYFAVVARHAGEAGAISDAERDVWLGAVAKLAERGRLFGTVGYFLFTGAA